MIIFGTRGVSLTRDRGTFHCPGCGARQPYVHKRVRRFFTLYFIPVIPLDSVGEFVECQECRGTYRTEVLNFDPRADGARFEAEFQRGMRHAMIHMMMADGEIDDQEIDQIREIYARVAGTELRTEDIQKEIDELHGNSQAMLRHLGEMAPALNEHGKEMIIKTALMVAVADGEFQDEEKVLLAEIARALQMTESHFRGIMAAMSSQPMPN